jgi:hypothetical protein
MAGETGLADFFFTGDSTDIRETTGLTSGTLSTDSSFDVRADDQIRLIYHFAFPPFLPPIFATVQFVYGVPFEFRVNLESKVKCTICTGQWRGVTDSSNTLVLDSVAVQGMDPQQVSIESDLGNVYANIVPEPSSALLNGSAVLTLALLRRASRGRAPRQV